jgi:zinc protease
MRAHDLRSFAASLRARPLAFTGLLALAVAVAGCPAAQRVPDAKVPTVATEEVPETERWRAEAPEPGEPPELVTPLFEEARLENGLRVIVSRRTELPLVSMNVAFLAGSGDDPAGKAGLAKLTYDLLLEGAGDLDAMALADAFADLGTSPYTSVGPDGALVGVRVLSRNAAPALDLLASIVRAPRLSEEDFARKRGEMAANLSRLMGEPRWLAGEALSAEVFGAAHPYGQPGDGTPSTLEALSLEDVRAYHRAAVGPSAAAFVVTGDVDLETAVAWAEAHFGDWEGEAAEATVPPVPEVRDRGQVVLIEQPGLQQTMVMLGRPGLAVGDDDELPLLLAGQIFGGMFGSRLNQNLREDKGYTYGAFSRVDARRGVGPLTAGSAVHAEVTGAALEEVFGELNGLRAQPISADELEAAREGIIRAIPGWFETIEALARTGATLFWRDLPMDRYEVLIAGLTAVTLEEVQAAAERYFDPATMQLVLVGDPEIVRTQVTPLGLGEIVLRHPGGEAPEAESAAEAAPTSAQ